MQLICSEVFTDRPANIGYIIVVPGFAEAAFFFFLIQHGYAISLVNGPEDNDFHPDQLTPYIMNYLEKFIYLDREFTNGSQTVSSSFENSECDVNFSK